MSKDACCQASLPALDPQNHVGEERTDSRQLSSDPHTNTVTQACPQHKRNVF